MAAVVAQPRPLHDGRERAGRRRLARSAVGWGVLILVVLAWAVTFRPTQLGGPATFVVVSGDSMEPVLHEGDLVVLRAQPDYDVGDVVTFAVPDGEPGEGALVIHRLIRAEGSAWVPQGDNRDVADEWRPTDDDIRGELWIHVPKGGDRLMTVMQPPLLAALAGGGATMWFLLRDPKARLTEVEDEEEGGQKDV